MYNTTGKEILIDSNVKFNSLVYYKPQILSTIYGLGTGENSPNWNNRTEISNSVLTILTPTGTDTSEAYLKLKNGIYNGQIKKIALHPQWAGTNINIMIERFCDPDGSIYSGNDKAQIILNKGGQTLNLLYIDDDTDLSDGYWILLDNNFDFI